MSTLRTKFTSFAADFPGPVVLGVVCSRGIRSPATTVLRGPWSTPLVSALLCVPLGLFCSGVQAANASGLSLGSIDHAARAGAGALVAMPSSSGRSVADPETTWLLSVLLASDVDLETRRGAASRLLTASRRTTIEAVQQAILAGRPEVDAAIVQAMAATELWPAPIVEEISDRLPSMIGNAELDPVTREAVAATLGRVPTMESLAALIDVLRDSIDQSNARNGAARSRLTAAAMNSLERLTRRQFGTDPGAWVAWWREARGGEIEELLELSVDAMRVQLEKSRADERRLREQLEQSHQRLAAVQAEVLLQLQGDARQDRLVRLLADPVAAVRRVAIDHIDRNFPSIQIPGDAVYSALLETLSDRVASNRLAAVRLLGRISRSRLAEQIAPHFDTEDDVDVLIAYLAIFRRLPTIDAAPRLLALVEESSPRSGPTPQIVDDASRALAGLVEAELIELDELATTRDTLRRRLLPLIESNDFTAFAGAEASGGGSGGGTGGGSGGGSLRLFALICSESDLSRLVELLEPSADGTWELGATHRRGIAEALRHRGHRDTLLAHAGDEAVFPALMRSLSDGDASLENLGTLVSLIPSGSDLESNGAGGLWRRAVVRVTDGLPLEQLVAADDIISAAGRANGVDRDHLLGVRREALARVVEAPDVSLPSSEMAQLVRRAARVELESGRAPEARRVLDRIADDSSEATRRLRFQALILSGEFLLAMESSADPVWWVDTLVWCADRQLWDTVAVLKDEIDRVFPGESESRSAELEARISRVGQALQAARPSPANSTDPQRSSGDQSAGDQASGEARRPPSERRSADANDADSDLRATGDSGSGDDAGVEREQSDTNERDRDAEESAGSR